MQVPEAGLGPLLGNSGVQLPGAKSRREHNINLDLAPCTACFAKRGASEGGPLGVLKARGSTQEPNCLVPVNIA